MKIIVFAGGVGTRLWPLSRKNTPKQFEKIIGDKSTLQHTVERLLPSFDAKDIYISTGKRYEKIVREQLPQIPQENFIFEPEMRDVGPAIGLASLIMEANKVKEPMAIIWSDHLVKNVEKFLHALRIAERAVEKGDSDFVFIAQKPRFANQNMGWIEVGEEVSEKGNGEESALYHFKRLIYRPKLEEAKEFLQDPHFVWNLGYFVTTPSYLWSLFEKHAPDIKKELDRLRDSVGTQRFEKTLEEIYPRLEKISFDDSILVKMPPDKVCVISEDLGWSDVGAWESLKEALSESKDNNVTKGKVMMEDSRDTLVYNHGNQLVVGIDLSEMLVINTEDVLLVCPKHSVPKIKKLVEGLSGTSNEHLT